MANKNKKENFKITCLCGVFPLCTNFDFSEINDIYLWVKTKLTNFSRNSYFKKLKYDLHQSHEGKKPLLIKYKMFSQLITIKN